MTVIDFVSLFGHRTINIALMLLSALIVVGHVWSIIRLAIQQVKGRAPSGVVVDIFDVIAVAGPSLFGGVNRAIKASGGDGMFAKPGESTASPPSGPTMPPVLPVLLLLALSVSMGCSAARSRLVDVAPTTPGRAAVACVTEVQRCNGLVPEVCMSDEEGSTAMRWWPMHPLSENGTPAECAHRCVLESGVASCAAVTP